MNYVERLENVTVIGAAGKMGSGILLLTAMEMADLSLQPENKDRQFVLNAVDLSHQALSGLMTFLYDQVKRAAEKKAVYLREIYQERKDLIENAEVIEQYIQDVLKVVRPVTILEAAYESNLIFEAIVENPKVKIKILSQIEKNNQNTPWYFTNTSSIPISYLNEKAGLQGRIIGFHFYNPPAVQRLVELIKAESTIPSMVEFAHQYAKNLKKKIVPSNDFAGFIGNGHFMRDALYGISELNKLQQDAPFVQALYMINKVSQDFLIRPMGIFQLIDYVGLDVCQYIMSVMNPYLEDEDLHSDLLDDFINMGVKGGQFANGAQKDGFLKYEKGRPAGVFDPDKKSYVPIADFKVECDNKLGSLPASFKPWRAMIGDLQKEQSLNNYFNELRESETLGAKLAGNYGISSKKIAQKLVSDGVAIGETDVNTVLLTGFYHSYGPINNYFKED